MKVPRLPKMGRKAKYACITCTNDIDFENDVNEFIAKHNVAEVYFAREALAGEVVMHIADFWYFEKEDRYERAN